MLADDGLAGPKHVGINRGSIDIYMVLLVIIAVLVTEIKCTIKQYVTEKHKNTVLPQLQVSCSGRHSSALSQIPLVLSHLPRFVVLHIFGDEFEALASFR